MKTQTGICRIGILVLLLCSVIASAAMADERLRVDKKKVHAWNEFADKLYALHEVIIKQHEIRTESEAGGYADQPNVYTETRYYDKHDNRLLSRVQRMNHDSKLIQMIEVNIYDKHGKIVRDYLAAYLPFNRNAPIQTLINLHAYHGELHGFRQFDASGDHIYEQCEGRYQGKPVMISLEEYEFSAGPYRNNKIMDGPIYRQCFADIPGTASAYLDPDKEIALLKPATTAAVPDSEEKIAESIADYSRALKQNPKDVAALIKRGDLYFQVHEFELAIEDYSDAIALDDKADEAYFGRGMARGRYGQISEGIEDLTVYISRHPDDSRAYTKRGVRYLWQHNDAKAEPDFSHAIALNPDNAEAHDDLGVIIARRGKYGEALKHFTAAVRIDPSYFKAYHNQAMVYFLQGQDGLALEAVDHSLALVPDQRNSILLKANILKALGRDDEAAKLKEEAEFLPEGNWSEHISVQ
jgi:tetratricopeptide (TPR) repeat protein